jgi:hypothetical protein
MRLRGGAVGKRASGVAQEFSPLKTRAARRAAMVAQATAESHQGSEPVHMQKNLPEQKLSPLATRASVSLSHDMPSFLLDVWLDCSKLLAFRDHNSH